MTSAHPGLAGPILTDPDHGHGYNPMKPPAPTLPRLLNPSGAVLAEWNIGPEDPPTAGRPSAGCSGDSSAWSVGNQITARVHFPASHIGFQGHFPGYPILPGFLQIQTILDVIRLAEPAAQITGVISARFIRPIKPEMSLRIIIIRQAVDAALCRLELNNAPISQCELQLSCGDPSSAQDAHTS